MAGTQTARELGQTGEDLAARFLENRGYKICQRNWRYGHLELDLICQWQDTTVFVEVKTRASRLHGGPAGAINPQKIGHLKIAAQAWLREMNKWNTPCRFDVICIIKHATNFSVEHYPDALRFSQTLDSGYAYWQF